MSVERLETFSYDTGGLAEPRFVPSGSYAGIHADDPTKTSCRIVFKPLTAEPVSLPIVGPGRVQWLLGEGCDLVAAALAWAMSTSGSQDSLIADTQQTQADLPGVDVPTRIGATNVYRGHAPAMNARLRDWVLFLDNCRSSYNRTILTPASTTLPRVRALPPAAILQLADGVTLLSQPDHESVYHTRRELNRLRQAGVRRCECLWLDAA